MLCLWWIFREDVDIRLLGSVLRSLLALKIAIMPVVPTGLVLAAKCLIKQYVLNRAWCQLLNLPVGLQKEYALIYYYLSWPLCEISFPSSAAWHCSVLKEVVSRGAAPAEPQHSGCRVPGRHCCAREQVFPSPACVAVPAPAAKLSESLLCWLEYSVCPAVGMEAVSHAAAPWGDNAPCCSRESLLGCLSTRQVLLLPKSPGSQGSLPCNGGALLVFDKEKWAAPIFRKPISQCGIYSVDTNIVLELKWLMFSWGGTRVMESSRVSVCCLFPPCCSASSPLPKKSWHKEPTSMWIPSKAIPVCTASAELIQNPADSVPSLAERLFTKESCRTDSDSWLYKSFWK